jgi:ubiquinone/menaquinone biosynthesis C-methylase UbiE
MAAATTTSTADDPFGVQASGYAIYRPNYPEPLIEAVLARLRAKGLLLHHEGGSSSEGEGEGPLLIDICTGSGQVLRKLAGHFKAAKGFDRSVAQLANATQLPNVAYSEADACAIPLPDGAAAVATVAQAMHWLDLHKFLTEVDRLLQPGGVAIVLGYPRTRIPALPEADAALLEWYDTLTDYWDARIDRHLLDREFEGANYRPLVQVGKDRVEQEESMTPARLAKYLRTWSAFNAWKKAHPDVKPDTVDVLEEKLAAALANAGRETLPVTFVFFAIYLQRPEDAEGK